MQRHYIIHGNVQGVFFRDSTRQKARELGVRGWVRNRSDGTVEAVAQGDANAVESLEAWFQEGGPPEARVERVEVEDQSEQESFEGFQVRR